MRNQPQTKRLPLVLALIAALAIGGCATPPTAPDPAESAAGAGTAQGGAQLLLTSGDGQVWFNRTIADTDTVLADYPSSLKTCDRGLQASADIVGRVGGALRCGRFTLRVPPGAFDGTATIKMSVPDSLVMLCDMDISPGDLNGFKVPVELSLNLTNLEVSPNLVSIFWYDPTNARWSDMGSVKSFTELKVTSYLNHFSRYAGGKAGW